MDTIVNFLVDNYIWIVIICVFLILVLIGYIVDQKRKLNMIKQQNSQGVASNNVNVPIQEEVVTNQTVAPAPVATEPVVNEPIINSSIVEAPDFELPSNETPTQTVEQVGPSPIVEPQVIEPVVEQSLNAMVNEPVKEEMPQTILDIPENVADISVPKKEEIVSETTPIEIEAPTIETAEIIDEPEIIEEIATPENIVNLWEPELVTENNDIINETENKDSI